MTSSPLLPAVQAEQQLTEMLQGAMHFVVNGIPAVRGHESITRRAEQLLYQCSGDVESAITLAIHESELKWSDAARKVLLACIPFVGLAASTLDLLWSQLRLVATIASLYGHDVYASDIQYRVLLCIVQGNVTHSGERSTVNLAARQVSRAVLSNAVGAVAGTVVPVASIAASLVSLYGGDVSMAGQRARTHFAPHLAIDLRRLRTSLYVYGAVQIVHPAWKLMELVQRLPLPAQAGAAALAALAPTCAWCFRGRLLLHAGALPTSVLSFAYFFGVECLRVLLAMRVGSAAHLCALAVLSGRDADMALAAYYAHLALCGVLTLVARAAPDSVSPALKQAQNSVQLALLVWPLTGLHLQAPDISRLGIVASALALLALNTAVQELRRTDVAVLALGSQRVVQGVLVVLGAVGRVVVSPSELLAWVENAAPPPTLCIFLLAVRKLAVAIGLLHGALVLAAARHGTGLCGAALQVVENACAADGGSTAVVSISVDGGLYADAAAVGGHGHGPDCVEAADPLLAECASPEPHLSVATELLAIALALSVAMNAIWHYAPPLGRFRIFVLLTNDNQKQAMTKIAEWVHRYEIAMQPVMSWSTWTSSVVTRALTWVPGARWLRARGGSSTHVVNGPSKSPPGSVHNCQAPIAAPAPEPLAQALPPPADHLVDNVCVGTHTDPLLLRSPPLSPGVQTTPALESALRAGKGGWGSTAGPRADGELRFAGLGGARGAGPLVQLAAARLEARSSELAASVAVTGLACVCGVFGMAVGGGVLAAGAAGMLATTSGRKAVTAALASRDLRETALRTCTRSSATLVGPNALQQEEEPMSYAVGSSVMSATCTTITCVADLVDTEDDQRSQVTHGDAHTALPASTTAPDAAAHAALGVEDGSPAADMPKPQGAPALNPAAVPAAAALAPASAALGATPRVHLRIQAYALGGGGTAHVRADVFVGDGQGALKREPEDLNPPSRMQRLWQALPSTPPLAAVWSRPSLSPSPNPEEPAKKVDAKGLLKEEGGCGAGGDQSDSPHPRARVNLSSSFARFAPWWTRMSPNDADLNVTAPEQ